VPRIKAGRLTANLLEDLANILRPRAKVRRRFNWYDETKEDGAPKRPSDLMSIDYVVEEGVSEHEFFNVWPATANSQANRKLLSNLSEALNAAIEDAMEMEVETNEGYGISDADVPSVAAHRQNEHRSGFLPIVRVMAEIWTKLAEAEAGIALPFVQRWSTSALKLNKRLALFAAADKAVPAEDAANVLLSLPQGLLFFTNSSVEVFRILRARWHDFPKRKRDQIEHRIMEGPPRHWFRSEAQHSIDRSRYDLLGDLQRAGFELSEQANSLLVSIQQKYPVWRLRPAEQAGFHIWHESGGRILGDSNMLKDVPDNALVNEAKKIAEKADFMDGDSWQALCQDDPQRALRGLSAEAQRNSFPSWAWNSFLWAANKIEDPPSIALTAELLLTFPNDSLSAIVGPASWWLDEKANALDEKVLWPLWDRIEAAAQELKEGDNA
jgi:hypothetical protein